MTSTASEENPQATVRRFVAIEAFNAAANETRLTPMGLVLPLAEIGAAAVGTRVALDWRLEDGLALVIGWAEVVEVTGPRATLQVIELDPACRIARLFAGEIGRPVESLPSSPDTDDTVVDLVERTYGRARGARPAAPFSEVFLPPAPPAPPAPAASREPPTAGGPAPLGRVAAGGRRSRQIAAALVTAGVLGLGARFAFARLEPILSEMLSDSPAVDSGALDVPPPGVQPSRLPPPAPVPQPAPTPEGPSAAVAPAAEASPVSDTPLDRLRSIRWERVGDTTVVTLFGNGRAYEERLLHTRLDAPQPRELLKVRGVDLPFRQAALDVGTPELQRIRVGFHPRPVANELHIVLDLPSHGVALTDIQVDGQTYRLVLSKRR